jgi:hypothetical protein
MAFSRQPLSGSPSGRSITPLTSQPGTVIHTVSTATNVKDIIYLWITNLSTTEARLIDYYHGGTESNDRTSFLIPPLSGPINFIPGWTLFGGTSTGAISGFTCYYVGTASNNVKVWGYVDRIVT